jgi:transcription elongation factor GreB
MSTSKPKAKPLTREGFKKLAGEHDQLMLVERPKVLQGIQIAAAEGDRSENAEYIYGRKRLRELDKRLRYLGGLLKDVTLVDPESLEGDRVCFGSTVTVMDEDGKERTYTIVGEGEAEFHQGGISFKSPVAKALHGKRVGDVVVVHRPAGEIEFEVVGLKFGSREWDEKQK